MSSDEEEDMLGARNFTAQVPPAIHIQRKIIFNQVAKGLHLQVQKEGTFEICPNMYVGKIQVSGIPNKDGTIKEPKDFYSDFATTPAQAVEKTYNEALQYLVRRLIIVIDDYNYPALTRTKSELFGTTTSLMLSEDAQATLQYALDNTTQIFKIMLSDVDDICTEASHILPISRDTKCRKYSPYQSALYRSVISSQSNGKGSNHFGSIKSPGCVIYI